MVRQAGCATTPDAAGRVTVGVDTHRDLHVAVALNQHGGWLGTRAFPTTPSGFAALTTWATHYGALGSIGIEGTGDDQQKQRHCTEKSEDVAKVFDCIFELNASRDCAPGRRFRSCVIQRRRSARFAHRSQ